jgi:membrane-associated phospholipid phosphatase
MILQSKKIPLIIKGGAVAGFLGLAALVALAKVALGQHWTTDVMAGTLLGLGTGMVSMAFFNYSLRRRKKTYSDV